MKTEQQLANFFAKYDPAIAKLGKALRTKLRARLPGLFEIVYVYASKNSLVISYSPIDKGYGGVCAIWLEPASVKLYFGRGAELAHADPNELLQGRGATVRHIVMNAAKDLERAEIEALIVAALELAEVRLDPNAKGTVIVKAEEQKQRAAKARKKAVKKAAKKPVRKAAKKVAQKAAKATATRRSKRA